jgi:hypothetical protein
LHSNASSKIGTQSQVASSERGRNFLFHSGGASGQNRPVEQLCFFKFERPLVERFGKDFFQQAPRAPGVYLMLDHRQKVIYVGQSHNLRIRLAYYKNAQPEREPRRIIRLIHRVERIEIHPCESAEQAQLRELELIRQHRPRFNVANTLSPTYSYFCWRVEKEQLNLRLIMKFPAAVDEEVAGAFKGRGACRRVLLALGRLLWSLGHKPASIHDLPLRLSPAARSTEISLGKIRDDAIAVLLQEYMAGESGELTERLAAQLPASGDPFLDALLQSDLSLLNDFFATGPRRLRELKEAHGLQGPVPQEQLDALLLQMRQRRARANEECSGAGATGGL